MCGIAGFWGPPQPMAALRDILDSMAGVLGHRGPDSRGVHADPETGLGLAHTRLAILDLSEAGAQPMWSRDGRLAVVYNGEIYNHLDIRRELEEAGLHPQGGWRGHSDTETLLAGCAAWGLERTLARAVGMFAIALWDNSERTLALARDRLGKKPLYYGFSGPTLLFGSQPTALARHPHWRGEVNRDALALYLRRLYVPEPHSIYRSIYKLAPGSLLRITEPAKNAGSLDTPARWWRLETFASTEPDILDMAEAEEALDRQLRRAVADRMLSDVPLGLFLSGGVDSATIAALMQEQSHAPVRTFSIGSAAAEYDEGPAAAAVARHLGTDHTPFTVQPREVLECIPLMPQFFDEPFADASQAPTYLVARLARNDVTVALSGDGGDELFFGYNRYLLAPRIWSHIRHLPSPLRRAGAALLRQGWAVGLASRAAGAGHLLLRDKAEKVAASLQARDRAAFFSELTSYWKDPVPVLGGANAPTLFDTPPPELDELDFAPWMAAMDQRTYLPGDILTKVDRATMAVGLESRAPLLDHRVVELAWRMAPGLKLADGRGKLVLRRVLGRYVPDHLVERPKQGFGIPLDQWLRGELRPWAEELLRPETLQRQGFFRVGPVRSCWDELQRGSPNRQYHIWAVLMFQAWLETHHPSLW